MIGAAVLIGGYAVVGGGGGGGNAWAGTFDCYGVQSLPSSCYALASSCTFTATNNTNLGTDITAAAGGDTICLNGGPFNAGTVTATKSSNVTIQPLSGTTATLNIDFSGASHWDVLGVTIGSEMDIEGADHVTIEHSTWAHGAAGVMLTNATGGPNASGGPSDPHILLDYDDFTQAMQNASEGRITFWGNDQPTAVGSWQLSHSLIADQYKTSTGSNADCADGIDLEATGGHNGSVHPGVFYVGPGNEFTNIYQSSCTAHADPVAFQDNVKAVIFDNYFHANSDGSGGVFTQGHDGVIKNNVFLTDITDDCVGVRGSTDWTFLHNYFGPTCSLGISDTDIADSGTMTSTGNAVNGGGYSCTTVSATCVATYNLNFGVAGTGNISGSAVLVSSPASGYYHYQLDSTSPGYHAVNDGTSMGICDTCG